MNNNNVRPSVSPWLAWLGLFLAAFAAQAQQRTSPYDYYYPPTPPPGANPKPRPSTPPPATAPGDTPQGPYAYPAMPSPEPAPKPLTELEALKRENDALRKQLAGANTSALTPAPQAPKAITPTTAYKVRRGDSLWGLAIRHGTRVSALRELNGLSSERIVEGQVLQVPTRAVQPSPAPAPKPDLPPPPPVPSSDQPAAIHVVKSGESLGIIASRFRVSQQTLQAANRLSSPNKIYAGQKLLIPGRSQAEVASLAPKGQAPVKPANNQPRYVSTKTQPSTPEVVYYQPQRIEAVTSYRIQPGDTLDSLATTRGLSRETIIQINGLGVNATLRPGEELILPVNQRTISM